MPKLKGLTNTNKTLYQDIDLEDVFGVSFSGKPALRQAIGQAIIDRIIERTEDNKTVSGGDFARYSKSYVKSAAFRRYGKSKGDVNMTLKGSMLDAIDITKDSASSVRIGFDDKTNEKKAANHNKGNTVPKREFFGIKRTELDAIRKDFKSEIDGLIKMEKADSSDNMNLLDAVALSDTKSGEQAIIDYLFGDLDDDRF